NNKVTYQGLGDAINILRDWNYKTAIGSKAMTLAHYYGTAVYRSGTRPEPMDFMTYFSYFGTESPEEERLQIFTDVLTQLTLDFGTWELPWGDVNRYQRLNGDIRQEFDDSKPSIPVGFASGRWGALAAYGVSYRTEGAKKIYGTRGNSFVAVVEFGDKVKAKSMLAGGQSGNPKSPHFNDQAQRYADMEFKDVLYYKDDVMANAVTTYQPGEKIE
ncbi:MAG: penicillin acylase family protein, partial [Bacteroidota bacterium]